MAILIQYAIKIRFRFTAIVCRLNNNNNHYNYRKKYKVTKYIRKYYYSTITLQNIFLLYLEKNKNCEINLQTFSASFLSVKPSNMLRFQIMQP